MTDREPRTAAGHETYCGLCGERVYHEAEAAATPALNCALSRFSLTPHSHHCTPDEDRAAIEAEAAATPALDVERLVRD